MNITSQIIGNPEGGTVSLAGHPLPKVGYFVGGRVSPLVVTEEEARNEPVTRAVIQHFADYVSGLTVEVDFLGWWTDEEDGKLWVDATDWYATEFEAARVGRERREIAIRDIAGNRNLRLVYVDGE